MNGISVEALNVFINFMQVFVFPCLAWIAWQQWRLSHKVTEMETLIKYGLINGDIKGGLNNGRNS